MPPDHTKTVGERITQRQYEYFLCHTDNITAPWISRFDHLHSALVQVQLFRSWNQWYQFAPSTSNDHVTNRNRFWTVCARTAVADRVDIYGAGLHGFAQPHAVHRFGSARFEGNPAYASRECTWWC